MEKKQKKSYSVAVAIIALYVCQFLNVWAHHELWVQCREYHRENIELRQEVLELQRKVFELRQGIQKPLEEIQSILENIEIQ